MAGNYAPGSRFKDLTEYSKPFQIRAHFLHYLTAAAGVGNKDPLRSGCLQVGLHVFHIGHDCIVDFPAVLFCCVHGAVFHHDLRVQPQRTASQSGNGIASPAAPQVYQRINDKACPHLRDEFPDGSGDLCRRMPLLCHDGCLHDKKPDPGREIRSR